MESTVIFGNPGTGKTYDLVERIKKCKDKGYTKNKIQVLSHTKIAAQEISKRGEGALAKTIHALAYQYGDISPEQVASASEIVTFSEKIGIPVKGVSGDGTQPIEAGDEYMALITRALNELKDPLEYARYRIPVIGKYEEFVYFYKSYLNWKNAFGMIDFNDMIHIALHRLEENTIKPAFELLFIDEAQDLTYLQWAFIDRIILKGDIREVVVTGDTDQALFLFGGANPSGMETFAKTYNSKVQELSQSYRVPKEIHKISEQIINKSQKRYSKDYRPTNIKGSVLNVSNSGQCNWPLMHGKDTLILYRTHSLRREIESELIRYSLPYSALNGKPGLFNNTTGRAIKAFLKVSTGKKVHERELRNLKKNATPVCLELWKNCDFDEMGKLSLERAIIIPSYHTEYYTSADFSEESTIQLSTIHGAKGMEADIVFVLDGMPTRVIENMEDNMDEELRVWFVAVTRAKQKLVWINSMEAEGFQI